MNYNTFIKSDELIKHISNENYLIFDCSYNLFKPDIMEKEYKKSHIPNSFYAHLDKDLSGDINEETGNHPLPDRNKFHQFMINHGLTEKTQVVVYDKMNGIFAARMWWLLKHIGFNNVAVLEGGYKTWKKKKYLLTESESQLRKGNYSIKSSKMLWIDTNGIYNNLTTKSLNLIDSREYKRYIGKVEPLYHKSGHIPSARNMFFLDNLEKNGLLKPKEQLKQMYEKVLKKAPKDNVFYCGSGVTACFNILVAEHIGFKGTILYPGSWSEWIIDDARPIEK